jgi:AMMECR1 domain-containing protein
MEIPSYAFHSGQDGIIADHRSQKGTFLPGVDSAQKERALEAIVLEPFNRIAGVGFEPTTFGL